MANFILRSDGQGYVLSKDVTAAEYNDDLYRASQAIGKPFLRKHGKKKSRDAKDSAWVASLAKAMEVKGYTAISIAEVAWVQAPIQGCEQPVYFINTSH